MGAKNYSEQIKMDVVAGADGSGVPADITVTGIDTEDIIIGITNLTDAALVDPAGVTVGKDKITVSTNLNAKTLQILYLDKSEG